MGAEWISLPNVMLVEIFTYLDHRDRISASSVCKSWRHCLFYSRFWTELKLKSIKGSTAEGSLFLAERVPLRCIRKLALTFDTEDQCVMQVNNWLVLFTRAERLSEIVLRPRQCITSCIISAHLARHLAAIVAKNRSLRVLDFGHCRGLLADSELRSAVSGRLIDCLESLNAASLKDSCTCCSFGQTGDVEEEPRHASLDWPMLCPPIGNDRRVFGNITKLGLDYGDVKDQLLEALCGAAGLRSRQLTCLHVLIQGPLETRLSSAAASDASWSRLVLANPECLLHLTVVRCGEAVAALHDTVLKPSMPLASLSTFFCQQVNVAALEVLSQWYDCTLRSVCVVDTVAPVGPPLISAGRIDPLILLAWKCHKLESVTFIGRKYTAIGIVGISRLCGPRLRCLDIADCCVVYDRGAELNRRGLCNAVGSALRRKWAPLRRRHLEPVLTDPQPTRSAWQNYVLERMHSEDLWRN